jgi:CheY-like chemotaxis protein
MYKILVVDDDIETLRMVEQFLEREGYIVDTRPLSS